MITERGGWKELQVHEDIILEEGEPEREGEGLVHHGKVRHGPKAAALVTIRTSVSGPVSNNGTLQELSSD